MASLHPRCSSAATSSIFSAPAPSRADRLCFDPSRVLMQADVSRDGKRRRHGGEVDCRASKKQAIGRVASPVARLSCARIRAFVHAPCPKANEETHVVRDDEQEVVTKKENTGKSTSCKNIEPAVQASSLKHKITVPSAGDGVIKTKKKAGERVQGTVKKSIPPPSNRASAMKARRASVPPKVAQGVIKTKQETSERVQATVTKSIRYIRPPASAAIHQDPHAAQPALRAALATAHQARDRRQQNCKPQLFG